jgi:DNA transformation protein
MDNREKTSLEGVIGPKTRSWLHEVGIDTLEQLEAVGAVEAYKRIKIAFPDKVTLNALYGLHAVLVNIHWQMVTAEMKAELRRAVEGS